MALQVVAVSLEMVATVRPLRAAIRVAVAWGYFAQGEAESAEELLRRVLAMLWKLTR